jgi:hypothetical protein
MAKKVMIKIAPASGDPLKGADEKMLLTHRGPIEGQFDIRDRLAELVGKGNQLTPDDKAAIFGSLTNALGRDKATKVMTHAYIFNQRPDVAKLPLEDKLKAFYSIGSNDPDVNQLISKSKSLGYGTLEGFRNSASSINQGLSGQTAATAGASLDPEVQKKVLIRIGK